jgi:hypothetical protein
MIPDKLRLNYESPALTAELQARNHPDDDKKQAKAIPFGDGWFGYLPPHALKTCKAQA